MNISLSYLLMIAILLGSCSYGTYGSGNKTRDILIMPGWKWTRSLATEYYKNGKKFCEGKEVEYNNHTRSCLGGFICRKGLWKYWDQDGNLVWTEFYKFNKKLANKYSNNCYEVFKTIKVDNEMPDTLKSKLHSMFLKY